MTREKTIFLSKTFKQYLQVYTLDGDNMQQSNIYRERATFAKTNSALVDLYLNFIVNVES